MKRLIANLLVLAAGGWAAYYLYVIFLIGRLIDWHFSGLEWVEIAAIIAGPLLLVFACIAFVKYRLRVNSN